MVEWCGSNFYYAHCHNRIHHLNGVFVVSIKFFRPSAFFHHSQGILMGEKMCNRQTYWIDFMFTCLFVCCLCYRSHTYGSCFIIRVDFLALSLNICMMESVISCFGMILIFNFSFDKFVCVVCVKAFDVWCLCVRVLFLCTISWWIADFVKILRNVTAECARPRCVRQMETTSSERENIC